jgi:hypothetical protein
MDRISRIRSFKSIRRRNTVLATLIMSVSLNRVFFFGPGISCSQLGFALPSEFNLVLVEMVGRGVTTFTTKPLVCQRS